MIMIIIIIIIRYHPYIVERHGKTLLPQYLAMYRLTVDNVEHYMVLMRNVFTGHLRVSSLPMSFFQGVNLISKYVILTVLSSYDIP